jgi:ABC-type multidrug transport system permease subunit
LSKGKVVFDGEPAEARQFLESCPDVNALPPETGKADWIMDVITDDEKRDGGGSLPLLWTDYFENKQNQAHCQAGDDQLKHRNSKRPSQHSKNLQRRLSSLRELQNEPKFEATFLTQLKLLIIRAQRQGRGERITRVALFLTICWTIFTGLAWGYIPDNSEYVFNRASLLYFILIAQSNSVVTTSMLTFGGERRLLSRERAKKMYGVLPYFIAKTLADMANSVAMPMIYGIAVYWICNLRPAAAHFFIFVLIYYLSVSAAQSFGLFLSIAIPNFSMALMLAPLLTICLIILGGFYIPYDKMGPALAWASWISPARYGFTSFIVNEFYGRQIPCAPNTTYEVCPLPGSSVISSFGISGVWSNLWINVGMLVAIQVFLRVVTYFLLLRSK